MFRSRMIRIAHENPSARAVLLAAIAEGHTERADLIRLAQADPGIRPLLMPLLKKTACGGSCSCGCSSEAPTMAKFEEGKPADPTDSMSPEDAKRWQFEQIKNRDKFKSACGCSAPEEATMSKEAARISVTKTPIRTKHGEVVPSGSKVTGVEFMRERPSLCLLHVEGRPEPLKIQVKNLHAYLAGYMMPPSRAKLAEMIAEGKARTPTGKEVAPDAWASDGSPSWVIVLGYV